MRLLWLQPQLSLLLLLAFVSHVIAGNPSLIDTHDEVVTDTPTTATHTVHTVDPRDAFNDMMLEIKQRFAVRSLVYQIILTALAS